MIIGIDCGHTLSGGASPGAAGYINESVETRKVGRALIDILIKNGNTVVDCTDDYGANERENLQRIVERANAQKLELFVSVHFNSGGGKGSEAYVYDGKQSKAYGTAKKITENLANLGFINRGVKDGSGLYVVKNTNAPSILAEICFVDSETDARLYKKLTAQNIALALAKAIDGNIREENMSKFKDIEGHYAEKAIKKLEDYGIVNGDGKGNFNPDEPITRADAAIMIANTLNVVGK